MMSRRNSILIAAALCASLLLQGCMGGGKGGAHAFNKEGEGEQNAEPERQTDPNAKGAGMEEELANMNDDDYDSSTKGGLGDDHDGPGTKYDEQDTVPPEKAAEYSSDQSMSDHPMSQAALIERNAKKSNSGPKAKSKKSRSDGNGKHKAARQARANQKKRVSVDALRKNDRAVKRLRQSWHQQVQLHYWR